MNNNSSTHRITHSNTTPASPTPSANSALSETSSAKDVKDIKFLRHLHTTEQQFKKRFNALKNIYEARITHLTSSIQHTFDTINTDELLQTMNADPTTKQFVPKAVAELVQNDLSEERERFIHQVSPFLFLSFPLSPFLNPHIHIHLSKTLINYRRFFYFSLLLNPLNSRRCVLP